MNELEQRLFKRLSAYAGKTQSELRQTFSVESTAKNINEVLLTRMLDYEDKTTYTAEFRNAGIVPKTIRIQKNGHIKESMSFPTFKFTEIINESWENSTIYRALAYTRFMFVVFEENAESEYVFSRVKFWTISANDLQEVKRVWQRTAQIIREGVILSYNGKVTKNNLPKQTESPIAHVRPHAQNGNDTYPLPDGRSMVKQSFWLNRNYIENVIKEIPEELYGSQERLTVNEEAFLKDILIDDFLFLEDINKTFADVYGKDNLSHINSRTMRDMGYVCYPDYIIKSTYKTAEEYFQQKIKSRPVFDLADWDIRMLQGTAAAKVLELFKSKYEIIEYEEGKFISFSHIRNVVDGMSKEMLFDFTDEALVFLAGQSFFNAHSLRRDGFKHQLLDLGFSDCFYDSLLKYSGKVKYLCIGGNMLFYVSELPKSQGDFLRESLMESRSMDIELYIEGINQCFDVSFKKDRVLATAKLAGLYYDAIMEKIYYDKEDYYDEI